TSMELTWAPSRYASYFCNGYFVKYSSDRRIVISLGSQQVADISISSSPPFPPPVRRVIFAFSKSSWVNPFLRRTCLAEGTSLVLTARISSSRSSLLARIRAWAWAAFFCSDEASALEGGLSK